MYWRQLGGVLIEESHPSLQARSFAGASSLKRFPIPHPTYVAVDTSEEKGVDYRHLHPPVIIDMIR